MDHVSNWIGLSFISFSTVSLWPKFIISWIIKRIKICEFLTPTWKRSHNRFSNKSNQKKYEYEEIESIEYTDICNVYWLRTIQRPPSHPRLLHSKIIWIFKYFDGKFASGEADLLLQQNAKRQNSWNIILTSSGNIIKETWFKFYRIVRENEKGVVDC